MHETLQVNGEIGFLKNTLLHYSVENYTIYKNKMLHYGTLKGEELFAKGKKYSFMAHLLKTVFKFIKSYIFQLGILDGKNGFLFCYLQAAYVEKTHATLAKNKKTTA